MSVVFGCKLHMYIFVYVCMYESMHSTHMHHACMYRKIWNIHAAKHSSPIQKRSMVKTNLCACACARVLLCVNVCMYIRA